MPSQYRRGRDFEYATRDDLREHGYEVVRSAGSKTKIDLIGIKPGQLVLVQCKLPDSRLPNSEWSRLLELALMAGGKAVVAMKEPGESKPQYRLILRGLLPGERASRGTHYEIWRPHGARP